MKKYFMIGLALVLLMALSTIFYGAWLNEKGEYNIAERMEGRRLSLRGAKAEVREIRPKITMNTVSFTAPAKTDAVALIEGRITECLAPKGSFVHKGDVIFQRIDVDQEPELAREFGIEAIPMLMFITPKGEYQRLVGLQDAAVIEEKIAQLLNRSAK